METTLYFIRHGESEGNAQRIWVGQGVDAPLTERGHEQARLTAEALRDIPFDALYASDLSRAMQTAAPIAAVTGLPVIPDKGLREIDGGEWQNKHYDDLVAQYGEAYRIWLTDIGRACPTGGESTAKLRERAHRTVLDIVRRHQGQTVGIVTHATVLRALKCDWLGLPTEAMSAFSWVPNASVSKVVYEDNAIRLVWDGNADHLGDLFTAFAKNV